MGVTIRSKNHEIDLGYFGFFNLRMKIAELAGDDVGSHYYQLREGHSFPSSEEEEEFWKEYDETTRILVEKSPKNVRKVFDFLYEPDCEGSVTYGTCKQVLGVIGDYDDNIIYGYAGRPHPAMFRDFKIILEDCVENKCRMRWY